MSRSVQITRIISKTTDIAYRLQGSQFTKIYLPSAWKPSIDAFRYDDHIEICVDLAGVKKNTIQLQVEEKRLYLRGNRPPPESVSGMATCRQILAMEIENGEFERTIDLPFEVEPQKVTARQENGLLWIHLPMRK